MFFKVYKLFTKKNKVHIIIIEYIYSSYTQSYYLRHRHNYFKIKK